VVLVTNQSGIGRGLFSEADFGAVQRRLVERLAESGARLDGVFHCPHSPHVSPACDCRKPAPALFFRAANELGIDLARSLYVGDRLRDVEAGAGWGGAAFVLADGLSADLPAGVRSAPTLLDAVDRFLGSLPQD
jgi:D-glycero-D-manno-heptose 1,7-bisphosphate phosphatase